MTLALPQNRGGNTTGHNTQNNKSRQHAAFLNNCRCLVSIVKPQEQHHLQKRHLSSMVSYATPRLPEGHKPNHRNPKYQPFWIPPFSKKHPQDNFSLQNLNWHPPKCELAPPKNGIGDLQSAVFCLELHRNHPSPIYILEGVNLHFGG